MNIGFTTVTFRGKNLEELVRIAEKSGAAGIEWGGDVHVAPGDPETARRAAELTRQAGLEVLSYGSYYRTDDPAGEGFLPVLESARALGAKLIRVWAGEKAPGQADAEYRARVAASARAIADMAKPYGITVAFEYHRNTLTQDAGSALALLEAVGRDNVKCYWQPNPDITPQENRAELKKMLPYLCCVHVFHWTGANVRHPLAEGEQDWQGYLAEIAGNGQVNFVLEFCKDDDDSQFVEDIGTLREWLLPKAVFLSTPGAEHNLERVFPPEVRQCLKRMVNLREAPILPETLEENREVLRQARFAFSTWGMPSLTEEQIGEYLPKLEAVFYGAGSVQMFARPFLEKGIAVHSAWGANAVPVAEYALAQILLANKGFFQSVRRFKEEDRGRAARYAQAFPGNYRAKVGILGAGMIGSLVCRMLGDYHVDVLLYDPFASDEKVKSLGAVRATLEEIFEQCQTISNHIANNPQTRGMLDYRLFSRMKPNAVFLNTGRGAQVVEADLVRAMREEPGRTAVLDVTDPEPPMYGHDFYALPNVLLTPHIAGSSGNEVERMGAFMAEECRKKLAGLECSYEVSLKMLETMA